MSGNSARRVTAYDIGPANALIDAAVARHGGHPAGYDQDGAIAASGSVHEGLLAVLLNEPYYRLPAPKSTGKELFHLDYIDDAVRESGAEVGFADLVATLTELTVRTVADDVRAHGITTLLVSGGGARNPVIMDGLRSALSGTEVLPSDAFGAPSDDKEAIAFALIGWCTAHGLPGSDPAGTGARSARVLGTLTPGAGPLVMPAPLTTAPESLTLETGA
ncbi:MAG: anhydro-N-acetylmuramic acid kinase [Stackebrandtia sp.]